MKPLAEEFKRTDDGADDDEVSRRKNDLSDILKQMEILSKLVKELLSLGFVNEEAVDKDIKSATSDYDTLCNRKEKYVKYVKTEFESRELKKQELFDEGNMKIHLPKFSGYDSKMDYYSFKSDFLKIY